ncbi:DUF3649 domain-containing protein [Lampropedia puyangensis]|nr:DUF3649 domain-containing protein [Lampropedia puyangensis]
MAKALPALTAMARYAPLVSRIVAALLGGYALAALTSLAALALPLPRSEAALAGLLASFLVYATAAIWVFAARSAARAWLGLLALAVLLAPWVWWVHPQAA